MVQSLVSIEVRLNFSCALMALSTKMSQLGHYETIRILGMCIGNVVHEQNPVKMTSLTRFRMLELYFRNHVSPIWCPHVFLISKAHPQLLPLWELSLAILYLSMSWRWNLPSSIALTIHLQRRLVLATFMPTSPSPPNLFFMQHSFQLILIHVSYSIPDQR